MQYAAVDDVIMRDIASMITMGELMDSVFPMGGDASC